MRKALGVLLLGAAIVLTAAVVISMAPNRSAPAATTAAAAVPSSASSQNVRLGRATDRDVIAVCGKPDREWTTVAAKGNTYEADTKHLWYARIPVEVQLVAFPNDPKPQFHYWTYAGSYRSRDENAEEFESDALRKKMPCMKPLADAWDEAARIPLP